MNETFKKYLPYAIGEIILVVIGILIALQINNWNQKRIDKEFELTMLKEIKSSLDSDLNNHKNLMKWTNYQYEGVQELLSMIASNKTYADTILLNAYNKMARGIIFDYNEGGYEGLKSVGLDKISNDSLRTHLIMVYEVRLPAIKSFYKQVVEDVPRNKDYRIRLHDALWKRIQIKLPDGSFKIVSRPIDPENFLNQTELIDRIKIEQDNLNFVRGRLPEFEFVIKRALDLVNKELEGA